MWLSLMKPITLRPISRSTSPLISACMTICPASTQIEHGRALAGLGQAPLAKRERVLEHDEDTVLAERGLGLGRTAAVVRASTPTIVFEIATASSPSGGRRSTVIVPQR